MAEIQEIAFITESNGHSGCISAWNFHTGIQYKSYKNGCCAKHALAVTDSYLLAAQPGQALIHVWSVSKEQLHMKIACPGKITALACSQDSAYCVAAIEEKVYVWQLSTGNLLSVLSRHYQAIRCIRFVDDCSHFITGGDDGLVIAWRLADVIAIGNQFETGNRLKSPSDAVNCLSTSIDGNLLLSASEDCTVKLWHTSGFQCIKINQLKGPITNLAFTTAPHTAIRPKDLRKQCLPPLKPFKRYLYDPNAAIDVNMSTVQGMKLLAQDSVDVLLKGNTKVLTSFCSQICWSKDIFHLQDFSSNSGKNDKLERKIVNDAMEAVSRERKDSKTNLNEEGIQNSSQLQEEISKLREINKNFYLFAVNELFERN
ncbi:uncharacterized protein TRIADDRAFT_58140 [Trichoplax adhaerens]|uniref:Uncharacterized protein n=1 Tax=Trichoplax adhaerens TaxID=10228 RepID=B3S0Z6_TRIAD|nr:hypothetical protein TRIADDRAFT_58140 [Trichoplax adhaerens]EDV23149.1 hypothetical protein TRIADDRAFT_58140 [Trichoplax adhaerens]|eukprot:XP_002114059.1 hypothetical protein TRIADDRAFT_58140 [Trichoplax adhaerens]